MYGYVLGLRPCKTPDLSAPSNPPNVPPFPGGPERLRCTPGEYYTPRRTASQPQRTGVPASGADASAHQTSLSRFPLRRQMRSGLFAWVPSICWSGSSAALNQSHRMCPDDRPGTFRLFPTGSPVGLPRLVVLEVLHVVVAVREPDRTVGVSLVAADPPDA